MRRICYYIVIIQHNQLLCQGNWVSLSSSSCRAMLGYWQLQPGLAAISGNGPPATTWPATPTRPSGRRALCRKSPTFTPTGISRRTVGSGIGFPYTAQAPTGCEIPGWGLLFSGTAQNRAIAFGFELCLYRHSERRSDEESRCMQLNSR